MLGPLASVVFTPGDAQECSPCRLRPRGRYRRGEGDFPHFPRTVFKLSNFKNDYTRAAWGDCPGTACMFSKALNGPRPAKRSRQLSHGINKQLPAPASLLGGRNDIQTHDLFGRSHRTLIDRMARVVPYSDSQATYIAPTQGDAFNSRSRPCNSSVGARKGKAWLPTRILH